MPTFCPGHFLLKITKTHKKRIYARNSEPNIEAFIPSYFCQKGARGKMEVFRRSVNLVYRIKYIHIEICPKGFPTFVLFLFLSTILKTVFLFCMFSMTKRNPPRLRVKLRGIS